MNNPELAKIGDLGQEYGVTTGRRRKVNWLNFDLLKKAVDMTGPTQIIVNKVDILEELGIYMLIDFYKEL